MYTLTIGKQILKRYKLQWRRYNGKRYYIEETAILHDNTLNNVKRRAFILFGKMPDSIRRI